MTQAPAGPPAGPAAGTAAPAARRPGAACRRRRSPRTAPAAQPAAGARRRRLPALRRRCPRSSRCSSWQANGRAADNTEQVVRVQEIQSSLLRADALATNAFLGAASSRRAARGLRRRDRRRAAPDHRRRRGPARRPRGARRPQRRGRDYTTAIAQARDNNRQGFPVGGGYLNVASQGLRADEPTAAVHRQGARRRQLRSAPTTRWRASTRLWLLWLRPAGAGRAVLGQPPARAALPPRINLGLAVAAVRGRGGDAGDRACTRSGGPTTTTPATGPTSTAVDEATARTAANDAKAQESQGLINRGSGAVYEEPTSTAAAGTVDDTASPRTLRLWNDYVDRCTTRGAQARRRRRLGRRGGPRHQRPGRRPDLAARRGRCQRRPDRRPTTPRRPRPRCAAGERLPGRSSR